MPLEQLIYTPKNSTANEHPNTMVLMVDGEMFDKYKGDKSIPIATVVDSYQVFKYEKPGSQGQMAAPSKSELQATFGTTNETAIVEFMLANGELHSRHRPKKEEKAAPSHVEDLLNAERRKY